MSTDIELLPRTMDGLHDLATDKLLELCLRPNPREEVLTGLVRRIQKAIRSPIYKSLKRWTAPTRDEIDEVCQMTFEKLWANDLRILRHFEWRDEKAFKAYMRVVASTVAEDHRRIKMRVPLDPLPDEADFTNPRLSPDSKIMVEQIYAYLETRCSKFDCDIFWCHHTLGLSARTTAEIVNRGVKEVEYILWRLMQMVRDKFAGSEGKRTIGQ